MYTMLIEKKRKEKKIRVTEISHSEPPVPSTVGNVVAGS